MYYTDLTSFPRCGEVLGKDQTGDAEAYQVLK